VAVKLVTSGEGLEIVLGFIAFNKRLHHRSLLFVRPSEQQGQGTHASAFVFGMWERARLKEV
jgi:hypothetical protein